MTVGLGNPISDVDLNNSVKADLTFDQAWSVSDMANLVLDFHSVDMNSVAQLTLPVSVVRPTCADFRDVHHTLNEADGVRDLLDDDRDHGVKKALSNTSDRSVANPRDG